jgi:hypothetical protein
MTAWYHQSSKSLAEQSIKGLIGKCAVLETELEASTYSKRKNAPAPRPLVFCQFLLEFIILPY